MLPFLRMSRICQSARAKFGLRQSALTKLALLEFMCDKVGSAGRTDLIPALQRVVRHFTDARSAAGRRRNFDLCDALQPPLRRSQNLEAGGAIAAHAHRGSRHALGEPGRSRTSVSSGVRTWQTAPSSVEFQTSAEFSNAGSAQAQRQLVDLAGGAERDFLDEDHVVRHPPLGDLAVQEFQDSSRSALRPA
jgi:hypothetical protein